MYFEMIILTIFDRNKNYILLLLKMDHHHVQRIKIKFNSICETYLVRFYIKYLCTLLKPLLFQERV